MGNPATKAIAAWLGKPRQVQASRQRQEILIDTLLAAGLGNLGTPPVLCIGT